MRAMRVCSIKPDADYLRASFPQSKQLVDHKVAGRVSHCPTGYESKRQPHPQRAGLSRLMLLHCSPSPAASSLTGGSEEGKRQEAAGRDSGSRFEVFPARYSSTASAVHEDESGLRNSLISNRKAHCHPIDLSDHERCRGDCCRTNLSAPDRQKPGRS
jgi:hypothetical protein